MILERRNKEIVVALYRGEMIGMVRTGGAGALERVADWLEGCFRYIQEVER